MAPSVLSEVVNIYWTFITLLKSSHMFKKHGVKYPRCVIVCVIYNWFYYEWFLLLFWFWLFIIMMSSFDWFLILFNPLLFVNLLGLFRVLSLRFDPHSMYWFIDVAFWEDSILTPSVVYDPVCMCLVLFWKWDFGHSLVQL